ncbi:GNAT family N-acetyltransferase [Modicisalibacter luteus]|uniref:GNAT family N-acetyltransferase n=1 Tax=Modicisalibacter luteus TaxID=453962 RepID=A0ABV7M361_9GAMM|nr:GNAT family N-acetyltransferase [Halomonas lutea]GHA86035.1 N-acetyltransferase [Halomonas lutea]
MSIQQYTTYYLEMLRVEQLRAKPIPEALNIAECRLPQHQFNRFLYELVGSDWEWGDLDDWTDSQWQALVAGDDHRTWVAYYQGAIAGYYELYRPDGHSTEIRYFGLAPGFIGLGFGGPLLSHAINSAWAWAGTKRVWVHTCTFDHPSALRNYQARGLKIYKEEVSRIE